MGIWHIKGGNRLEGTSFVQGSKNAVLPVLSASVISPAVTELLNVPRISDVDASLKILRHLGCTAEQEGNNVYIDSGTITNNDIPCEMMQTMRSSVLFMGALLARCGEVRISDPGGCDLGARPVDMHLSAMKSLGAEIINCGCETVCRANKLKGSLVELKFPSVGATENAMLCACGCEGETVIKGAAKEPEIVDLQEYLRKLGAYVGGAGTDTITLSGFAAEHSVGHRIIPDRIAAATYLCAAAAAGGDIELRGVDSRQFLSVSHFLNAAGCDIIPTVRSVRLISDGRLHALEHVVTEAYPGFPTDCQPLLMAALLKADGKTTFTENIFERRYGHTNELKRFGADITVEGKDACVWGVRSLNGAAVTSTDLRGGAAMVIAGLSADGDTTLIDNGHILRGYECLDEKLRALGANIYTET